MTNPVPVEILEQRAAEQRRRIHNSVVELRSTVRERLDYKRMAREYVWQAAGAAVFLGFVIGWGIAGIFTGD